MTYFAIFVIVLLALFVLGLACQVMRERADNERLISQNRELSKRLAGK